MIKKYITGVIIFIIMIGSANNQVEQNLDAKLSRYKECFIKKDYICMSSMVVPEVVESLGGVEGFVEFMTWMPSFLEETGMSMDASKMEFGNRGPIVADDGYLVSVIPTTLPILINGENAVIEASVIGFSGDSGETWFFIEGNDEGRMLIGDNSPRILQKLDIPNPKLRMGDKTLIQKNGQWVTD